MKLDFRFFFLSLSLHEDTSHYIYKQSPKERRNEDRQRREEWRNTQEPDEDPAVAPEHPTTASWQQHVKKRASKKHHRHAFRKDMATDRTLKGWTQTQLSTVLNVC